MMFSAVALSFNTTVSFFLPSFMSGFMARGWVNNDPTVTALKLMLRDASSLGLPTPLTDTKPEELVGIVGTGSVGTLGGLLGLLGLRGFDLEGALTRWFNSVRRLMACAFIIFRKRICNCPSILALVPLPTRILKL